MSFALVLTPKLKIAFKCSLSLFKEPGTVDRVSPSDSGTPQHGKPWNIPWVPRPLVVELLNPSQLCTGLCLSAFQLLVLGFLSWVQSCFYPSVSSNDLGYLRPGAHEAHCAWLCSQLSLFYLCPLGVLLWPAWRKGAPQCWTAWPLLTRAETCRVL